MSDKIKVRIQMDRGVSLAIPQRFDEAQPNHFSAPFAKSTPLEVAGFVGDTRQGGSCNVDCVTIVPHCNGTHTETVGHIVGGNYYISRCPLLAPMLARLISVYPTPASETSESYDPPLAGTNRVITRHAIEEALTRSGGTDVFEKVPALIIRTFPNDAKKKTKTYRFSDPPAFFTHEAMKTINSRGVKHLLVDLPSVDRMDDEGKMSNHCIFWDVTCGGRELTNLESAKKTITELIFAPDDVVDGVYLLDLQVISWETDASPSRPILFELELQ